MRPILTLGLILLAPAAASAEFLRIEQSLTALDCASCAQSLAGRMKRMRGVESADLTPDGFLRLELKRDNTVKLETIRDLAKGGGFTPKEARVKVRGKAVETAGKWELQIEGLDEAYSLERAPDLPPLNSGQRILAVGIVLPAQPRVTPILQLTGFQPEP
jgi:hypothetical protein